MLTVPVLGMILFAAVSGVSSASAESARTEEPIPALSRVFLSNGVELWIDPRAAGHRAEAGRVGLYIAFDSGARTELEPEYGVTNLMARALFASSTDASLEWIEKIRSYGGTFEAGANHDYTFIRIRAPVGIAPEIIHHLRKRIYEGEYSLETVANARSRIQRELALEEDIPALWLRKRVESIMYYGHPYARDPRTSEGNLEEYLPVNLQERREKVLRPDRMKVAVVGPVQTSQIEALFSQWPEADEALKRRIVSSKSFLRVWRDPLVAHRRSEVGHIAAGFIVEAETPLQIIDTQVLAEVLAGGHGSRLIQTLVKRGALADHIEARFIRRLGRGYIWLHMATSPRLEAPGGAPGDLQPAGEALISTTISLSERKISAGELERAKARLIMANRRRMEDPLARAEALIRSALEQRDIADVDRFESRVNKVRLERIQSAAIEYLRNPAMAMIDPHERLPVHVADMSRAERLYGAQDQEPLWEPDGQTAPRPPEDETKEPSDGVSEDDTPNTPYNKG